MNGTHIKRICELDAGCYLYENFVMQRKQLLQLLQAVSDQKLSVDDALEHVSQHPFSDVGVEPLEVAKVDHHRGVRCGFSEVIFGPGKTPADLVKVVEQGLRSSPCILTTRIDEIQVKALLKRFPKAHYNARARTLRVGQPEILDKSAEVLVVTAGTSDVPVAEEALETLKTFGCPCKGVYDVGVAGLHRLLNVIPYLRSAGAIICVAGMEGALPSVVGGLVSCPVIAVPTSVGYGAHLQGLAPLLAMLNTCASGVSVVNIDNGFGAAMCALRIMTTKNIGTSNPLFSPTLHDET
jgi:NCAIR mutase (PurE)-related protein